MRHFPLDYIARAALIAAVAGSLGMGPAALAAAPAKAPAKPATPAAAPAPTPAPKPADVPLDAHPVDVDVPAPATGMDVTIYTNGFAMIRERRSFHLPGVLTRATFSGVPRELQPETALFNVLKGGPAKVVEQDFDFDVITPAKLMEQAIGHDVTVITTNPATGAETFNRARILSATGGPVIEMGGKIYTAIPGRIVFDGLPPGTAATPRLVMTLAGAANQDVDTELSYLTGGLTWRADYVMQYDPDAGRMDLNAWATLTNTTGMDFKDAKLKLVSGAVNRVAPRPPIRPLMERAEAAPMAAAAGPMASGVSEQTFVGNHIYAMPRPVTLAASETKQLALLGASAIAVKRDLAVHGQSSFYLQSMRDRPQNAAAGIELSFRNDAKLGAPLPAGIVRIYSLDQQGAPQFVGESTIDHTAEGGDVNISGGQDYDLPVTREQTNFVRASDSILLSVWRITVRNAKSRPMTVKLIEPIPGNWEVVKESQSHQKTDSGSAEWDVQVPAKGQTVLEYNVKTQL